MTQEQIKKLEKELWEAADQLRAGSKLTAAEYKDPVLGLVLLRFAQNRYEEAKKKIEKKLPVNPRTGQQRAAGKDDFLAEGAIMLPEEAKYEHLVGLPEDKDIAEAINNAMKKIEEEYTELAGILPKNYQEFEADLLRELLRVFNKDAVKNATGDVFGRIYEYFLMKFSMSGAGAQEGGEFFTPPSLVDLIVNFIEPDHGIVHDCACGSGGMFVQTGYFVRSHSSKQVSEAIKVYGTELKTNNAKLAKMNLAIHGIEGKIIEANSFYSDPHNLVGKCDFVMANPPFNVNKVDKNKEYVKTDPRLPFGLPKADNGNYLWIQYFHSYLNAKGRAGFVMASSATDAGQSEKLIREKLVETGDVDCIVSVSNNFFYTRSLPCHLWFFDKGKGEENKDKILMIDARNVYRKVTTTINDFSPGQLLNLTTIMKLYRGEKRACAAAIEQHCVMLEEILKNIHHQYLALEIDLEEAAAETGANLLVENISVGKPSAPADAEELLAQFDVPKKDAANIIESWQKMIAKVEASIAEKKTEEKEGKKDISVLRSRINKLKKPLDKFEENTKEYVKDIRQGITDWRQLLEWFPGGDYRDVEGLCKIVTKEEVKENDFSLTPGRYVGVSLVADDGFDYKKRLGEINEELMKLNKESQVLAENISNALSELI